MSIRRKDVDAATWAALTGEAPSPKRKYGNRKVEVDGKVFDSAKEARRYGELVLLEREGVIADLQLQVTFRLAVNGVLICFYRSDFVYLESGQRVVEDCKGFRTREYRLKRRLLKALHGIDIRET